MKVVRFGAEEFRKQPWKNGGGTTTELAREGEGDRFAWRVSVADVERPGPFSAFPGYERTIVLLEGEGMELTVDGRIVRLDRTRPLFVFDGGSTTTCRLLDGPTRDLNVIVDTRRARATVAFAHGDTHIIAPCALVYRLDGELVRIDDGAGERIAAPAHSIVIQLFAP